MKRLLAIIKLDYDGTKGVESWQFTWKKIFQKRKVKLLLLLFETPKRAKQISLFFFSNRLLLTKKGIAMVMNCYHKLKEEKIRNPPESSIYQPEYQWNLDRMEEK